MSTTIHNCLQPLARQLHPCHTIMAYQESLQPVITLNILDKLLVDAYIVHNQTGKLVSPECQICLIGPATVYLVASRFANLYYIIQDGRCTCPRGRAERECLHLDQITLEQIIADEDLLPHLEDTPMYNAIRGGKFVEVTWNQLTAEEQRAAYHQTFSPCA